MLGLVSLNDLLLEWELLTRHTVAGSPKMNVTVQEVGLTGARRLPPLSPPATSPPPPRGRGKLGVGEPSVDSDDPGWRLREWGVSGL